MDTNHDDRLEADEANPMHPDTFSNLDADDDSSVSFMELVEPRLAMSEDQDPDGSGCWTYDELLAHTAVICSRLDAGEKFEMGPFVSEGDDIRCLKRSGS